MARKAKPKLGIKAAPGQALQVANPKARPSAPTKSRKPFKPTKL